MTENLQPQREAVLVAARAWLGTPYHHQARIRGAGVDCAMLLAEVYREAGVIGPIDPRPYPPDWHLHRSTERYLGWLARYGAEVPAPQPGDVAVFRVGRCFSHGAIVEAWPQLIHAVHGIGCVRGDATQGRLAGKAVRFFTLWPAGRVTPAVEIEVTA